MVFANSLISHDPGGTGLHRRGDLIVFWIFHPGCKGATLSQFSSSTTDQYACAILHAYNNAYLYEYFQLDSHPHPYSGAGQHPAANPHQSPHLDVAADLLHSIRDSPGSQAPNRYRHPSNRHQNADKYSHHNTHQKALTAYWIAPSIQTACLKEHQ